MTKNHIFIYTAIHNKYDNDLIPKIPKLIVAYLLKNPSKVNLYLADRIQLEDLLKTLAIKYKEKRSIKLLDEIINYVEV